MSDIANKCLVSGTDGFVTVTPGGRVILTELRPALRGEDIDRIAEDVGSDVALRTLAANGGTAAIVDNVGGRSTLVLTGRVGALIELPTARWFVSPTGIDGHTVGIPGDAQRFAVAIGATSAADVTPDTAATLSTREGQPASQFVVDLRVAAESDPTPVGLDIVDLGAPVDVTPAPLPVVSHDIAPPPAAPSSPAAGDPEPAPTPAAPPVQPAAAPAPGPGSDAARSADEANWVLGIRCPLDHHNHPEAGYCSQCGRKMGINATAVFKQGPRPPLGLFLLDDGGAIPVATDLLIGRDAPSHADVAAGTRQGVLLTDASNVVSRHHLAITLRDWDVYVADLGSANGTIFVSGDTGQASPLVPHQEVQMKASDRLQIGPRTLQLELHHVATPQ